MTKRIQLEMSPVGNEPLLLVLLLVLLLLLLLLLLLSTRSCRLADGGSARQGSQRDVFAHVCKCMCMCMCTYRCVYIYIYIYVHMYVCMYVCVYIYIYIHNTTNIMYTRLVSHSASTRSSRCHVTACRVYIEYNH